MKIFDKNTFLTICAAVSVCGTAFAAPKESEMDKFISNLMQKMTLDEKLGQLNLPPSDDIVTGQSIKSNIGKSIVAGQVGGTFNVKGAASA